MFAVDVFPATLDADQVVQLHIIPRRVLRIALILPSILRSPGFAAPLIVYDFDHVTFCIFVIEGANLLRDIRILPRSLALNQ